MDRSDCSTTLHVFLQASSGEEQERLDATWTRVLREGAVGLLIMLGLVALLGFLVSWMIGVAVAGLNVFLLIAAQGFFLFRGHSFACSAKKSFVLVFGWWEYVS